MISNGEMASKPSLEILMQQLLIVVAFDIVAPTLGIWLGPGFIQQLRGPNFTQFWPPTILWVDNCGRFTWVSYPLFTWTFYWPQRYLPHIVNAVIAESIYNSHYGNGVPAMFVQLKGKHCRKPHCRNGVVDTFKHWMIHWYITIFSDGDVCKRNAKIWFFSVEI